MALLSFLSFAAPGAWAQPSPAVFNDKDILDGYVPERSWMAGVTATKKLKPSSSEWVDSKEGPPPAPSRKGRSQSLPSQDVKVRVG